MKLDELRDEIDALDDGILNLVHERLELAKQVKEAKDQLEKPVVDEEREATVLQRLAHRAELLGIDTEFITGIFSRIIQQSRDIQEGR